ncbi:MAG: sugar phosphate nucleotidyltransferase [Pseudomonadales bacterium]
MKVMLLAAGAGEAPLPLTATDTQTAAAGGGRAIIERLLRALAAAGLHDIVINLHHLGEQIERTLRDGAHLGVNITYSRERRALETGGGIVQALPLLGTGPFAIVNADIVTDFNFSSLPRTLGNDLAHLVLTPTPAWRDAGDFNCANGRVTGRGGSCVYCGIAVACAELFAAPPDPPFSWREPLWRAVNEGRVGATLHTGQWLDIGTPAQYASVR